MYKLLNEFMKKNKSSDNLSVDDSEKSELKYYNFDFILIDEKDNQQILDSTMIEDEFDEKAKTEEELEEDEQKKKNIKEGKDIEESTKKYIEDGKEICKSQVYVINGENPIAFTESCNDGQEMDSWFKEIFNSI